MTKTEQTKSDILDLHLRQITIEFTRVMGGGSECFTQVGDQHYLCPHYLRTIFADRINTYRRNERRLFSRRNGK